MNRTSFAPSCRRPNLEMLEPRLLLSAAPVPHFVGAAVVNPPVVTGISDKYDGNADPAVLGRYIGGVSVMDKITAKVQASHGDPVVSVTFKVGDTEYVDTNSRDGWGFSFDVGTLSVTTALTVTATTRSGAVSDPFEGQIQVVSPAWIGEVGATTAFSASKKGYTVHAAQALMEKGVEIPDEYAICGGKPAYTGATMTIDLLIPTAPAKAIQATITGKLVVQNLCKTLVSKTWKATAATDPTKPFNAQIALDPETLEITDLAGTMLYSGAGHIAGSLLKCPVATYLGVMGYLTMDATVDADIGFHYAAGDGIVLRDPSTLNSSTTSTLDNGSVNSVRPSQWPLILKWGISGQVNGTITLDMNGSYADPGPTEWSCPFSAHVWAQLTGSDPVEYYIESTLGSLTPDLLNVITDLA